MAIRIAALSESNREDFYRVHHARNAHDWCFCVAWWLPDWDGFRDRKSEDNRAMREELFRSGMSDGYILYVDEEPIGWCQCGPRDQFSKLIKNYKLEPEPSTWAITCLFIAPSYRRTGLTHLFLSEILTDLKHKGVQHVQAFPRSGTKLPDEEVWTGPESLYLKAGFNIEQHHALFPVYGRSL